MGFLSGFKRVSDNLKMKLHREGLDPVRVGIEVHLDPDNEKLGEWFFNLPDKMQIRLLEITAIKALEATAIEFGVNIPITPQNLSDCCVIFNGKKSSGERGAILGFSFDADSSKALAIITYLQE